jgi:hypothetical protein
MLAQLFEVLHACRTAPAALQKFGSRWLQHVAFLHPHENTRLTADLLGATRYVAWCQSTHHSALISICTLLQVFPDSTVTLTVGLRYPLEDIVQEEEPELTDATQLSPTPSRLPLRRYAAGCSLFTLLMPCCQPFGNMRRPAQNPRVLH